MAELAKTARLFHILGNSKKLRLLKILESKGGYSSELCKIVNLSRSTTTRYLNEMAVAGMLKTMKLANRVFFYPAPPNTFESKLARAAVKRLKGDKTAAKDLEKLQKYREQRPHHYFGPME